MPIGHNLGSVEIHLISNGFACLPYLAAVIAVLELDGLAALGRACNDD